MDKINYIKIESGITLFFIVLLIIDLLGVFNINFELYVLPIIILGLIRFLIVLLVLIYSSVSKLKKWINSKKIIIMLKLSFIDYQYLGCCWIGRFGFDKFGNIYKRKKIR